MTERETPLPERPRSEIEFILRNAKRRRGPDVLRDISRAGEDEHSNDTHRDAKAAKRRR